MAEPRLVLIGQAKEHSNYTAEYISFLLREGRVKGKKIGRIWLIDLDDLIRYERGMAELGNKKFDSTRYNTG